MWFMRAIGPERDFLTSKLSFWQSPHFPLHFLEQQPTGLSHNSIHVVEDGSLWQATSFECSQYGSFFKTLS